MTSATLQARADSPKAPDGSERGSSAMSLTPLMEQLTEDSTGTSWAFLLRAELEDAFDVALLRASLAGTPTLSDHEVFSAH